MRWLMAGAGLVLVVVGASFSPAWHRAAARGVVRLARKGAGVMRRRGAEPASTSLFPPLAVRPCGGWQGETGNRGGTRRPLSGARRLGSAGGTRDGLLRRHATGRAFRPCLVGSVKFLKKYIFMFEVLNID